MPPAAPASRTLGGIFEGSRGSVGLTADSFKSRSRPTGQFSSNRVACSGSQRWWMDRHAMAYSPIHYLQKPSGGGPSRKQTPGKRAWIRCPALVLAGCGRPFCGALDGRRPPSARFMTRTKPGKGRLRQAAGRPGRLRLATVCGPAALPAVVPARKTRPGERREPGSGDCRGPPRTAPAQCPAGACTTTGSASRAAPGRGSRPPARTGHYRHHFPRFAAPATDAARVPSPFRAILNQSATPAKSSRPATPTGRQANPGQACMRGHVTSARTAAPPTARPPSPWPTGRATRPAATAWPAAPAAGNYVETLHYVEIPHA